MGSVLRDLFGRKNREKPENFNVKVMRWINRIAILVFLLGILYKLIFG